ncbi:MAG TPA: glycosyltransferase family 9 protein [Caldimonas sp.]|nr:glycosyltransferase family 9 protein [Caldimonas sp.]
MHPVLNDAPIARIAVFRALMLGDMLCAVPALRALRGAFPDASITWIGLESTRPMAARLDPLIDDFIALPGYPGLPEVAVDAAALPGFFAAVRAHRFDLALQMHGSGAIVNPLVAAFGARHCAGFFDAAASVPRCDRALFAPWPTTGHEIERLLALTDHLGLPRRGTALEFPVTGADRVALAAAWAGADDESPYVCIHAGAQLPSRRWPVERFAAVADAIAATGRSVVLTGSTSESAAVDALMRRMRRRAVSLAGKTTLGALGALIAGAEAIVCNDTSVSHIAAALGCPSVVISCGADVARWAPLDRTRHRVLWQALPCRPCAHVVCPIGHACAEAISADDVVAALGLGAHRRFAAVAAPAGAAS